MHLGIKTPCLTAWLRGYYCAGGELPHHHTTPVYSRLPTVLLTYCLFISHNQIEHCTPCTLDVGLALHCIPSVLNAIRLRCNIRNWTWSFGITPMCYPLHHIAFEHSYLRICLSIRHASHAYTLLVPTLDTILWMFLSLPFATGNECAGKDSNLTWLEFKPTVSNLSTASSLKDDPCVYPFSPPHKLLWQLLFHCQANWNLVSSESRRIFRFVTYEFWLTDFYRTPTVGLEPTTSWLTVMLSTIEICRNINTSQTARWNWTTVSFLCFTIVSYCPMFKT